MKDSQLIDSELIATIYEAAIDPSCWPKVARGLANYLGAHQSMIAVADSLESVAANIVNYGVDPEVNERYLPLLHEDEWFLGMLQLPSGSVCVSDQFAQLHEYKKKRFFQEVCAPADVAYMGGAVVQNLPNGLLLVTAQRSEHAGAFQEHDMQKMKAVADHIARSAFLSRRTRELECSVSSLRSALHLSPYAVILCDEQSRVTWYNSKARETFAKNDGLSLHANRLRTNNSKTNARLDALVSNAVLTSQRQGSDSGGFLSVSRPSGKRPYGLTVCPVIDNGAWGPSAFAVIFGVDADDPPSMPLDSFERIFNVTHAEAKVCQALLEGLSIAEIADRSELSPDTVRTQLKSVFRKCSVRSQAELVQLLTRMLIAI